MANFGWDINPGINALSQGIMQYGGGIGRQNDIQRQQNEQFRLENRQDTERQRLEGRQDSDRLFEMKRQELARLNTAIELIKRNNPEMQNEDLSALNSISNELVNVNFNNINEVLPKTQNYFNTLSQINDKYNRSKNIQSQRSQLTPEQDKNLIGGLTPQPEMTQAQAAQITGAPQPQSPLTQSWMSGIDINTDRQTNPLTEKLMAGINTNQPTIIPPTLKHKQLPENLDDAANIQQTQTGISPDIRTSLAKSYSTPQTPNLNDQNFILNNYDELSKTLGSLILENQQLKNQQAQIKENQQNIFDTAKTADTLGAAIAKGFDPNITDLNQNAVNMSGYSESQEKQKIADEIVALGGLLIRPVNDYTKHELLNLKAQATLEADNRKFKQNQSLLSTRIEGSPNKTLDETEKYYKNTLANLNYQINNAKKAGQTDEVLRLNKEFQILSDEYKNYSAQKNNISNYSQTSKQPPKFIDVSLEIKDLSTDYIQNNKTPQDIATNLNTALDIIKKQLNRFNFEPHYALEAIDVIEKLYPVADDLGINVSGKITNLFNQRQAIRAANAGWKFTDSDIKKKLNEVLEMSDNSNINQQAKTSNNNKTKIQSDKFIPNETIIEMGGNYYKYMGGNPDDMNSYVKQ